MVLLARPSESVPLSLILEDGLTSLFPQAKVFSEGGIFVQNVNLAHVSNGLYLANYTLPATPLKYLVLYTVFLDSGRTVVDPTHGQAETIVDAETLDSLVGLTAPIVPSSR